MGAQCPLGWSHACQLRLSSAEPTLGCTGSGASIGPDSAPALLKGREEAHSSVECMERMLGDRWAPCLLGARHRSIQFSLEAQKASWRR